MRFGLDGRVLTVQLLPPGRDADLSKRSAARGISAIWREKARRRVIRGARPHSPGAGRTGQTSMSIRFPRDVSSWCRLEDQSGSILAFVRFTGVPVGGEGADRRDRRQVGAALRLQPSDLHRLHEPHRLRAGDGVRTEDTDPGLQGEGAAVGRTSATRRSRAIAIRGDQAAATLSNDEIVQLRRIPTGQWLIDRMGPIGAVGPDAAAQRRERGGP